MKNQLGKMKAGQVSYMLHMKNLGAITDSLVETFLPALSNLSLFLPICGFVAIIFKQCLMHCMLL